VSILGGRRAAVGRDARDIDALVDAVEEAVAVAVDVALGLGLLAVEQQREAEQDLDVVDGPPSTMCWAVTLSRTSMRSASRRLM
jgi:hypothetical protein